MNLSESRRSAVYAASGMVASSQPLASSIGLQVLREMKGNAADAAVAVAAALALTEPCSTGVGGDVFVLYYKAEERRVYALNGSGKSPSKLTVEAARKNSVLGADGKRTLSRADCVTVPGAVRGWEDTLRNWGTLGLDAVLAPTIELAEKGFPVAPITCHHWRELAPEQFDEPSALNPPPTKPGDLVRNLDLAAVLRRVAKLGAARGFYTGPTAEAICEAVQSRGGALCVEDLSSHTSEVVTPIKLRYRNKIDVYECPPNGQGIAALMALETFQRFGDFPFSLNDRNSAQHLSSMIRCMKASFDDCRAHVGDPDHVRVSPRELLESPAYTADRLRRAQASLVSGQPIANSDTVSFQVIDCWGNAASVVNSNYLGFGSGIVPKGLGFSLQSRGLNFDLDDASHVNAYAPNKRPYHTIIPGMTLNADDDSLHSSFTCMGGFMQPQGHFQLLSNLIDWGDDPQQALDRGRFCIGLNGAVSLEPELEASAEDLRKLGHKVRIVEGYKRDLFGRGQIILRDRVSGVLCAGSDGRADGLAIGY